MPHSHAAPAPYTLAHYDAAADAVRRLAPAAPQIGLVLGSGLSRLADTVEEGRSIPYAQIPHFPLSTVEGHAGRLVVGRLEGASVCVMQGRFHAYEGYSLAQTTFPIRVMHRLGVQTLILTNAAGGINPTLRVGDLMLIEDHLNLPGMMGQNPLWGPNQAEFGPRFPAMNRVYTPRLQAAAAAVAAAAQQPLRQGVYAYLSGPTFESPAEVRMLRLWGADAVGMSTVPEAVVARHAGMEVLGISTITNLAVDQLASEAEASHAEVLTAGAEIVPRLSALLRGLLARLAERQ